mmetsp:Transcript_26791/g.40871  ORF Transcript_26791/g.40871 Transcript_26791/m.40871 type:complete len:171 (+) Transcript_26791:416-928(+)
MYLVLKPMNIAYSSSLFFLAALISFLERNGILSSGSNKSQSPNMVHSLLEEEMLNIFLMVFIIPSGSLFKFFIHLSLSLWALMHVCEMGHQRLQSDPNTPGLSLLAPLLGWVVVSKYEIVSVKCWIETIIGAFCVPCVFMGYVALIFPILYFQYMRIKFVSSLYFKQTFT